MSRLLYQWLHWLQFAKFAMLFFIEGKLNRVYFETCGSRVVEAAVASHMRGPVLREFVRHSVTS
jgi:hypothetical protein